MLETYFEMILFPIKEILKLYVDPRLTDFLGVSLMSAIVTGVLSLLVFKALINPSGIRGVSYRSSNKSNSDSDTGENNG